MLKFSITLFFSKECGIFPDEYIKTIWKLTVIFYCSNIAAIFSSLSYLPHFICVTQRSTSWLSQIYLLSGDNFLLFFFFCPSLAPFCTAASWLFLEHFHGPFLLLKSPPSHPFPCLSLISIFTSTSFSPLLPFPLHSPQEIKNSYFFILKSNNVLSHSNPGHP